MSRLKLSQSQRNAISGASADLRSKTASVSGLTTSGFRALTILLFILCSFFGSLAHAAVNTGLSGDDRYAGRFPIGFEFRYYDKTYNRFYVSTNGLIQFANPSVEYNNGCLPGELNNTLYAFWDDLRTNVDGQPTGKIEYQTLGEAPNRRLVVQWTNQYYFGTDLPMGTFQAILFEGSNQIKYQYRNLLDERSRGASATVGIQGPAGQFAQFGCNVTDMLASGQAIVFTPSEDGLSYAVDGQAEYDFIDISGFTVDYPAPLAGYTNQAPGWEWNRNGDLNAYQIEIQNSAGESILQDVVGNVGRYMYQAGEVHGQTYRAKVRGSINGGATWEMWSGLSSPVTVDKVKPNVTVSEFNRLSSDSATIAYQATDDLSGVKSIRLQVASDSAFEQIVSDIALPLNRTQHRLEQLPEAAALYARIHAVDKAGNRSDDSATVELLIAAPTFITPVNGTRVDEPSITVSGITYPNANVQLFLDGKALDSTVQADDSGYFTTVIALDAEQTYRLNAKAQTALGTSPNSYEVQFSYREIGATVLFAAPNANAVLTAPTEITVIASDNSGIAKVELYDGQTLLTTLTEAPYSVMWQVAEGDNGPHTLKAVVTNGRGKIFETLTNVTVEILPPVTPPTPYTGKVSAVTPAISYGQPIVIEGQAVERASSQPMANAPLNIVLINNGFKRTIAVSSDDSGLFSYRFIPQSIDEGVYQVAVVHPNETNATAQGEFTVSRIKFHIGGYHLTAARQVPATIDVRATPNLNVDGLYWTIRAEDQPDGRLPQGISINGAPIDIAAGTTATTQIQFTADDSAAQTGHLYLVAYASESGDIVRGRLQIKYRLTQAQPSLYTSPNVIQTGLVQEDSITETVTLANRGLTAAENVNVALQDEYGAPAPAWIFLANPSEVGTVKVGDTVTINIVAQPDESVSDGIYHVYLRIRADNQPSVSALITISVVQNGTGGIRFDVADIYTATLDANGLPIPGVAGATIKLQNDTVLTEQYTLKTDSDGIAVADQLPPGIYLYRVSAPKHSDVSGRVRVRPGVINNEHIFLNYDVVNIEFSVTETTVKDEYEVQIDATYNTQVPAPVVLFEPMSISLNGMQVGEVKTGQLTLTNYGLVRADNLGVTLPQTDDKYRYEFFGDIPNELAPKTRIVIPYKVTKLRNGPAARIELDRELSSFAPFAARSGGGCSIYMGGYSAQHTNECANGDQGSGGSGGSFNDASGDCQGAGPGRWQGLPPGGGSGGGSGYTPAPYPIQIGPGCNSDCAGICCFFSGSGSANG